MKNTFATKLGIGLAMLALAFFSCVKTEFDEPPYTGTELTWAATTTIKELKQLHGNIGGFDSITTEAVIRGVVVMDDRSGNFYKTIVVQDASGGIEIKFNDGFLFNQYPVGREVAINCKGFLLADYGGVTQLTGSTQEEAGSLSDVGITEAQARVQFQRGLIGQAITPRVITMQQINDPEFLSTIVQLENVQFISADTGKTYANAIAKTSLNRTIGNCAGVEGLLVRSSGYAEFAAANTPGGNGTITGVLSTYNGDAQLYIRDLNDVKFDQARCVILCGNTGGNVTVDNLNETFTGQTSNQDIALTGWSNVGADGCRTWRASAFQSNTYAQATAFTSQDPTNTSWLISPAITAATAKTLNFKSSWAYYKHQGLTVWYSTNYDGTNFGAATWTQLSATFPTSDEKDTNPNFSIWKPSGSIALPAAGSGKIHIGFKYVGTGATNTTTWRIDDVVVN
jgi:hypothetical protein